MTARFLVVVVVAGCGRLGFDVLGTPGTDGAHAGDTTMGPDACASFGPWSAPIPITELNTINTEYGDQISGDGLTLYFDSDRGASNQNLYVAHRPDRSSPFGPAMPLATLNTASNEGDATVSADQLEIIFYRTTAGVCLYDARRASTSDSFSTPTATTVCGDSGAFLTHDGLTLYYNSIVDGNDEGVLYTTTRASTTDLFGPGSPIPELMAGATKGFPALTEDGLGLAFESDGGTGNVDLWFVTRATTSDPWGTPARITGLNSPNNDGDASFTDDGTEIFFEKQTSTSGADLFHATRSCQ